MYIALVVGFVFGVVDDEVIITSSQNKHVYCTHIVCVYYKICVCIIMLCSGDLVGVATETEKDASFGQ